MFELDTSALQQSLSTKLKEIEAGFIMTALERAQWNCCQAAKLLGIGRGNLQNRMKKLKIETPLQLARRTKKESNGSV